jgi:hypothetical protein
MISLESLFRRIGAWSIRSWVASASLPIEPCVQPDNLHLRPGLYCARADTIALDAGVWRWVRRTHTFGVAAISTAHADRSNRDCSRGRSTRGPLSVGARHTCKSCRQAQPVTIPIQAQVFHRPKASCGALSEWLDKGQCDRAGRADRITWRRFCGTCFCSGPRQ